MKKVLSVLLLVSLLVGLLASCAGTNTASGKLSIVATIFPEYDWVSELLGDKKDEANLTLLLDNGVDLHSYSPTAEDLVKISTCDLFIYVGGESDEWVEDVLLTGTNPDRISLNLLELLGESVKEEEVVEGMQGEEEEAEEEEEGIEYDEHVWLSLRNTTTLCEKIKDALVKLDAENESVYNANFDAYKAKLSALDKQYTEAVQNAKQSTLLFADRFPFRYLVDDYGLSYYAAFVGCSAETEAAFDTIAFLANKVQKLKLSTILTLEGSDQKIAETVLSTAGSSAKILCMDSMQSATTKDIQNGVTYLSVMEKNLETLKEAIR